MKYISTRGEDEGATFEDVMLNGLARDGGLYIPEKFPELTIDKIYSLKGKAYSEIASEIMLCFTGKEIDKNELKLLSNISYKRFVHSKVAPVKRINSNLNILELFHGPTLAFKDYAMQFLAQILNKTLIQKNKKVVILGATSGDTGSAALEAFKGHDLIDIFILYPNERVSSVQQKQMTTIKDNGAHAIAIDGDFDDCQDLVKLCFNDLDFRDKVSLTAINSINWVRLIPQIVYYFTSALELDIFNNKVAFSVPTGNFGNIFSAWVAKKMGLPIEKLIIATNQNDILHRFLTSGEMKRLKVSPSYSPSMDIQVSSNFERFLFELLDYNSSKVKSLLKNFSKFGEFNVSKEKLEIAKKSFLSYCANDSETLNEINSIYMDKNILIDPHTAVGLVAAKKAILNGHIPNDMKIISLACAHPSKFPEAVEKATGVFPKLPRHISDIMGKKEKLVKLSNNLDKLKDYILKEAR